MNTPLRTSLLALAALMLLAPPAIAQAPAPAPKPEAAPAPAAADLSARQILDKVDDLYRGDSSHAKMTMKVVTRHWTRTMEVPSSMMGGSWMGSHFTNDDLVKDSRMADDFDFKITFHGDRKGKKIIEITCVPKKDAAVVWGKIVSDVEEGTWLPTQMRYYDEDNKLARTMRFDQILDQKGRKIPTRMVIIPADKPAESTTVSYQMIEFDVKLDERLFSKRSLKR